MASVRTHAHAHAHTLWKSCDCILDTLQPTPLIAMLQSHVITFDDIFAPNQPFWGLFFFGKSDPRYRFHYSHKVEEQPEFVFLVLGKESSNILDGCAKRLELAFFLFWSFDSRERGT